MHSINLYLVSRARNNSRFDLYESCLSNRDSVAHHKSHEISGLVATADRLITEEADIAEGNGFFYNYIIDQVDKEFDLIKYDRKLGFLNIELKSRDVGRDKIKAQLLKNRHYFKMVSKKMHLFTFVEETGAVYFLNKKNELEESDFEKIRAINRDMKDYCVSGLEELFKPINFLISPVNNPDKFLKGSYFLTRHQEMIKDSIFSDVTLGKALFGITGAAGTGKSLLVYDMAKDFSKDYRVCLALCGRKSEGHQVLENKIKNLFIEDMTGFADKNLSEYECIFVDEAQRMDSADFARVIKWQRKTNGILLFAYDQAQIVSESELRRNIPKRLHSHKGFVEHRLTSRIRTNRNLYYLINNMFNLKHKPNTVADYSTIDIVYSNNTSETERIIGFYNSRGYKHIDFDKNDSSEDVINEKNSLGNSIGQEYDCVSVKINSGFYYSDAKLLADNSENSGVFREKLLYQAVSRCRNRLCIIVEANEPVFAKLVEIKASGITGATEAVFAND